MTSTHDDAALASKVDREFQDRKKEPMIAFILWLFLGIFGAHRYYLGYTGVGTGQLLTFGGLGIWSLIDGFLIPSRTQAANESIRKDIYLRHTMPY